MAREFAFRGRFEVTTSCADLDKIAQALNETARQFQDILKFNWDEEGQMWFISDMDLQIPTSGYIDDYEEEPEEAAEIDDDESAA